MTLTRLHVKDNWKFSLLGKRLKPRGPDFSIRSSPTQSGRKPTESAYSAILNLSTFIECLPYEVSSFPYWVLTGLSTVPDRRHWPLNVGEVKELSL